ncbi:hypothetical protein KFK09_025178 [Dendrobium nobile]|uniref:Uncharacterized protein n=1 Tax=Dendrobium nobile TaxID=94219 RepID=A0A8T3AG87_DENNO|nr:hypothetical protein KFK09_025178 [Dendrobium nobile]
MILYAIPPSFEITTNNTYKKMFQYSTAKVNHLKFNETIPTKLLKVLFLFLNYPKFFLSLSLSPNDHIKHAYILKIHNFV